MYNFVCTYPNLLQAEDRFLSAIKSGVPVATAIIEPIQAEGGMYVKYLCLVLIISDKYMSGQHN